jgi:5-(carboxyamino)imidazole ribonucleotide synthase
MTVGILGGGQLAMMLAQAAEKIGVQTACLTPSARDPISQTQSKILTGALGEEKSVRNLIRASQTVTFENEFLNTSVLEAAISAAEPHRVSFHPSIEALSLLQNKLSQKILLEKLRIPTAPFLTLKPEDSIETFVRQLPHKFPKGAVLKWATMGYDGKGTLILKETGVDALRLQHTAVQEFCLKATSQGYAVYAEGFIPFQQELSIIGCRSNKGTWAYYPLVISEQRNHVCLWVEGPATQLGVDPHVEKQAREIVTAVGQELDYVGCLTVELFHTTSNEILVNEIAPRVHNTGHHTILSSDCSQFENHIRAVSAMPVRPPKTNGLFVMKNLLGPSSKQFRIPLRPKLAPAPAKTQLIWYGKEDVKPWRKLGHISGVVQLREELDVLKRAILEYEENLWLDLERQA